MRILFDTNVILDVLLAREPFVDVANQLFSKVENREIQGYVAAITLNNLFYIIRKVKAVRGGGQVHRSYGREMRDTVKPAPTRIANLLIRRGGLYPKFRIPTPQYRKPAHSNHFG